MRILVVIALWIGLMVMRHRKGRGWLLMTIGTSILSVGLGFAVLVWLIGLARISLSGVDIWLNMYLIEPISLALGGLLFGMGFALHGLAIKAAMDRQKELEVLTAAMAEELRILRQGR